MHLILQPMSRQAILRSELARLGFAPISEKYSYADGKYYVCMLYEYRAAFGEIDPISAELGLIPDEGDREACIGYLESKLRSTVRARDGKLSCGGDAASDAALCDALSERINYLRRQTI